MPNIVVDIPRSLMDELDREAMRVNESPSFVITEALAQRLGTPVHTLFQVSTSGALVAGIYSGAMTVRGILDHGDFGLGTFAGLDGEMVVLDGKVYQVEGGGLASEAPLDARAPFAVVTRFAADVDVGVEPARNLRELLQHCDARRPSGNIFYAFRLDGLFTSVRARAVKSTGAGRSLVEAAKSQSEFQFTDLAGTLVGLWSPGFSSAFSVPGYHFHFLSKDRQRGGHLLECSTGPLQLKMEALTDFHLALPENESFLKADLSRSTAGDLAYAEQPH